MTHGTDPQAQQPTPAQPPAAEETTGFRIMRETEIAPGWWSTAREVGDTRSATVADTFCTKQNAVTDDPNRLTKRHRYFAEPVMAVAA